MVCAQEYPVRLDVVLFPPYSVRLSEYASCGDRRLSALLTDLLQSSHRISFRFSLEGGRSYTPLAASAAVVRGLDAFTLPAGTPLVLSNLELRALFEFQNLTGLGAEQYGRALPEGLYQFCFVAADAFTQRALSLKSCAQAYLQQYDPPQLTLPQNGERVVKQNEIQNILFQWQPRQWAPHTRYVFTLKELRDTSRGAAAGFLSARPLWEEALVANTLLYGIEKTALLAGQRYVWQVRAVSAHPALLGASLPTDDNAVYKNRGYSEIFYFDYTAQTSGRGRARLCVLFRYNTALRGAWDGPKPMRRATRRRW